ncbi:transglycosylase SLT domain-containing protein [Prevotella sp.]
MIKLFRVVLFSVCLLVTNPAMGANATADSEAVKTENFDWEPVMKAIVQVESEGNTRAVKGNSCGAMQITPILVAECNNILKKRNSKKRYTLRDRFSLEKSKEMFLLMQSQFNPLNDIEKAIRSWNGGNKYSVKRTQRYFEKVMKCLRSQK